MNDLIQPIKEIIIAAGQIAIKRREAELIIDYKEDHSVVTNADKEISHYIYNALGNLTPKIPVICEEQSLRIINSPSFWLVDPIDGTKSFVKNEDAYTINIALIKNTIPTLGFIYHPPEHKLYYTDANGQLKIEQSGIEIIENYAPKDYVAVVGYSHYNKATKKFLGENGISNVITVPSSLKLCFIATNKADIYPKFGETMEWDIAAGHALVMASGGDVLDLNKERLRYGKPSFLNPDFIAYSKRWTRHISHSE